MYRCAGCGLPKDTGWREEVAAKFPLQFMNSGALAQICLCLQEEVPGDGAPREI